MLYGRSLVTPLRLLGTGNGGSGRLGRGLLHAWLGIALGLLAASCKTNHGAGDAESTIGNADILPSPQTASDETRIPVALWSPGQRQAAATHYFLVAEYASLKERESTKALQLFEAAYGLDPNPFLGSKMLAAKAIAGQRAEALLEARKMSLLYPRDAQLRLLYGTMLQATGDILGAAEQLEKCIELDPSREQAYLELIQTYHGSKQTSKAIVVARELVKAVPRSVMGWSILSRLLLISGQPKEALVPARRAYEMQSSNPQLAQIYALTLQMAGQPAKAIRIYEQLFRLDPSDEEVATNMVELYRELGNLEDALNLLRQLASQGGRGRAAVEMQQALLLWEMKRYQEASNLLNKLLQEHPESDRLRYMAAVGLERLDRFDEAIRHYEGIPESSSLRFQAEVRVIAILKGTKRLKEALAKARLLVQERASNWEVFGLVAGIMADAKQYDEAVRTVDEGYRRFPERARLLFLKGVYLEKAGDRTACMETMRAVIDKDPSNSSAYNFLGYLYAERGENLDEAEQLIKKALSLKPNDGFYLDSLGWVYFQRGDYDKAEATLRKAAQVEPKEGVIYEHLAEVRLKRQDTATAVKLLKQALQSNLEEVDKQRIEKRLQELLGSKPQGANKAGQP